MSRQRRLGDNMKKATNSPLVSIIVPIYNVSEWLPRCLDSIKAQSYDNLEILLVNDGSTDDSKAICEKYAKADKRFVLINKKNGGVSSARNAGVNAATGSLITFIDPDDYVTDDYVAFLFKTISSPEADISSCGYTVHYPDTGAKLQCYSDEKYSLDTKTALVDLLYDKHPGFGVALWGKMFRAELFEGIRFPEGKLFEDTAVIFSLVGKAKKINLNLKSKYNYIVRNDSITKYEFDEKKLDMLEATDIACAFVEATYPELKKATKARRVFAHLSTLSQAANSKERPKKEILKELISFVRKNGGSVVFNRNTPKRNKVGVFMAFPGFGFYSFWWNLYSKRTGRKK